MQLQILQGSPHYKHFNGSFNNNNKLVIVA